MLAPLVVDECCLLSFFDFASATSGEATSPAIASAPINNLVFIMRMTSLGKWCGVKLSMRGRVPSFLLVCHSLKDLLFPVNGAGEVWMNFNEKQLSGSVQECWVMMAFPQEPNHEQFAVPPSFLCLPPCCGRYDA
jgi:hypothetical protein